MIGVVFYKLQLRSKKNAKFTLVDTLGCFNEYIPSKMYITREKKSKLISKVQRGTLILHYSIDQIQVTVASYDF